MNRVNQFKIDDHEISGIHVLEASAGTGKTYSLKLIFIKALVRIWRDQVSSIDGQDSDNDLLKKILVVTFTEAATAELKLRIHEALKDMMQILKGKSINDKSYEAFVLCLFKSEEEKQNFLKALKIELNSTNELSVFTINGFCNKILLEYPFECGVENAIQLITQKDQLFEDLVYDVFRSWLSKNDELSRMKLEIVGSPSKILGSGGFSKNFRYPLSSNQPIIAEDVFDEIVQSIREFQVLKNEFRKCNLFERSESIIDNYIGRLSKKSFDKKIPELKNIVLNFDAFTHNDFNLEALKAIALHSIQKLKKTEFSEDEIQHQTYIQGLVDQLEQINQLKEQAKYFIFKEIQEAFQLKKEELSLIDFDDQIEKVGKAIHENEDLVHILRAQFPIACIDEFQDTDSIQYQLFDKIYVQGRNEIKALYMVGDPKQSIYKFRNADIQTYLEAKQSADSVLSLNTNYRSSKPLVSSLNGFYGDVDYPFIDKGIEYLPVDQVKTVELNSIHQEWTNGLQLISCNTEKAKSPGKSINFLNSIVDVVKFYTSGSFYFSNQADENEKRLVELKDLAILVNTNFQASLIKRKLAQFNIPSIILSKESIYSTVEARHLYLLIKAIINARSIQQLRTALISPFCRIKHADLENEIDEHQHLFLEANHLLKQKGILRSISFIFEHYSSYSKLMFQLDGERTIANINHLLELLPKLEKDSKGDISRLVQLYENKLLNSDSNKQDEEVLKLESDEKKLKIVTIHGSKGLEFPIVINPYLWEDDQFKPDFSKEKSVINGRTMVFQKPVFDEATRLSEAKKEAEENARLMYVALTRAVYQNILLVPENIRPYRNRLLSPLSLWSILKEKKELNPSDVITVKSFDYGAEILTRFKTFQHEFPQLISIHNQIPEISKKEITQDEIKQEVRFYKRLNNELKPSWATHSYSSITRSFDHEFHIPATEVEPIVEKEVSPIFQIAKGADIGNIVHNSLERLDFNSAQMDDILEEVEVELKKINPNHELQKQKNSIVDWINKIIRTKISFEDEEFSLKQLTQSQLIAELEFHLASKTFNVNQLLQLIDSDSKIDEQILNGMLHGFIDLLFVHDGKFYLLDYKTNYLGDQPEDYDENNLKTGMKSSAYDVQMAIYSVVLHQFLKSKLTDYSYREHFGGMIYWFIRGVEMQNRGVLFQKYEESKIEQLSQLLSLDES